MNTPYQFEDQNHPTVYVKTVDVADLPRDVQKEVGEIEHLYAVHDANGQQLALVANRALAFTLARQNDFSPVAVH